MATRHIITMLEKTLQIETENTISHLTASLSDRILLKAQQYRKTIVTIQLENGTKIISYSNKMISFGLNTFSMTHIVRK